MRANAPVILGVGEILWDLLPGGKQLGGATTNCVAHAAQLGARGIIASSVGEDALGQEMLDRLRFLRLDGPCVAVDARHPTGTVDVQLDGRGVPQYVIHEGVAWDFIPFGDSLQDAAASADAICFGSLAQRSAVSRATIQQVLTAARPGCLNVFDINLRQHYFDRDTIDVSLRRADVLKLNDGELPVVGRLLELAGGQTDVIAQLMSAYPLRLVALTRGERGARLRTATQTFDHPGYPAEVVDTVGAGDAFTAALTMGLLRGDHPAKILDFACRLASFVCSQRGATPAVPASVRLGF